MLDENRDIKNARMYCVQHVCLCGCTCVFVCLYPTCACEFVQQEYVCLFVYICLCAKSVHLCLCIGYARKEKYHIKQQQQQQQRGGALQLLRRMS